MKKTTMQGQGSSRISEKDGPSSRQEGCNGPRKTVIPDGQLARQHNIEAIVQFFESGITAETGMVGIELEHTIVGEPGFTPVSYRQEQGILWVLEQLQDAYPEKTYDAEGDLLGIARPAEAITLEPAGQLELSAGPFRSLAEAASCFDSFEAELAQVLASAGMRALLIGYHPTARACDLELIPKRRYKFMNLYLGEIGPYGPFMMRGSASTQISIDYDSTADCLRKLRLAYALVPLFSLICDNTPVLEGHPRPFELVRTKIWQECDPDRCGTVPGIMDPGFDLYDYAKYLLDTPAILIRCKNREWCYSEKTFGELYAETTMDRADIEHAVSMLFNDVRLKTYIEIRPADAMPIPFVIAYAALIKGLFYSEENLDALDTLFSGITEADINAAKLALIEAGYDAEVYGRPVAELADLLVDMARKGLSPAELPYLVPLSDLISRRTTLAVMAGGHPGSD